VLSNVVSQVDTVDKWQWYLEFDKGHSVCGVYKSLTTAKQPIHLAPSNFGQSICS
jgi:hypothetical protein